MSASPNCPVATVNHIGDSLGSDRRTVSKVIKRYHIQPQGRRGAFRLYNVRVVERALNSYLESRHDPGPGRLELLRQQVRKLRIANDREEGRLVSAAKVTRTLKTFFQQQREILERRLLDTYPEAAAAAGLDPAAVRVLGKRTVDDLCRDHQAVIQTWTI